MSHLSHNFSKIKKTIDDRDHRAIVFINATFANCENIIQQINPEVRVIVINPQADGVKEITSILYTSYCREIYLVGQGFPGCLYLGNTELSLNTLIQYSSKLQSWFDNAFDNTLNPDSPRLHLSGCDVAAGDVGEEFIAKLGSVVGATIATSARVLNNEIFN